MALFLNTAPAWHGGDKRSAAAATCEKPIDLVHLSRQTMGDSDLENEVLGMFAAQCGPLLDRLGSASTQSERKLAAHTIVGSARSLGAWKVAEAAARLEADCIRQCDCAELSEAIDEANAYIAELLGRKS